MKEKNYGDFLQAWLFFGLLSEFSPSPGEIDIESFIERAPTGETFITTKTLMVYLSEWRKDMKRRSSRYYMSKLVLMLDRAISVLKQAPQVFDLKYQRSSESAKLFLLIGVLVETLQ